MHRLEIKNKKVKNCQIILSALTTGGLLSSLVSNEKAITIVTAIISTLLFAINLYFKEYRLAEETRQFRMGCDELWLI